MGKWRHKIDHMWPNTSDNLITICEGEISTGHQQLEAAIRVDYSSLPVYLVAGESLKTCICCSGLIAYHN